MNPFQVPETIQPTIEIEPTATLTITLPVPATATPTSVPATATPTVKPPTPTLTPTPEPATPTPKPPTPTPEPDEHVFTVGAWVKLDSLIPSVPNDPTTMPGDMSIMDKMLNDGYNLDGWRLIKQNDNHFWFCLGDQPTNGCQPGKDTTVMSSTVATIGQWTHVMAVRSSTSIAIYVNGNLEQSKPLPQYTDTNTAPMLIGKNALEGDCLNGKMEGILFKEYVIDGAGIRALSGMVPATGRQINCP
jgi:hypothetical protein